MSGTEVGFGVHVKPYAEIVNVLILAQTVDEAHAVFDAVSGSGKWVVPPASDVEGGSLLQQAGGTASGHLIPHAAKENFARPVAAKPNPRYPCTLDLRNNNHHEQT